MQGGKKSRDIVIELGIDSDILGVNRANGLKGMIRNEVRAGKGFRDLKANGSMAKPQSRPKR